MNIQEPFTPLYGSGVTVSAIATSANVAIEKDAQSVCITNTGSNIAYIKTSVVNTATATTADYPILPFCQAIITKQSGQGFLAYISADGTSLHVMMGGGF
jgi:hypothetical protein